MIRMEMDRKLVFGAIAIASLLVHASCHQVIMTAPPGSTIYLSANPESIPAYGGVSVISALVYEPTGTPVADGTVVQFFTNLGRIDEQGKTNDGVARVNLVSDGRSGLATVKAFSGGGSASTSTSTSTTTTTSSIADGEVEVEIGELLPSLVQVVANPAIITTPRWTNIYANVFDDNGNPLARTMVIFTVTDDNGSPAAWESLESGGAPIFTDNNGRAHEVLSTRYPADAVQRKVTVTATTANGKSNYVKIQINIGIATPTPVPDHD